MTQIPEGATHYSSANDYRHEAYWKPNRGGYDCYCPDGAGARWQDIGDELPDYAVPISSVWTGAGLPPVGTVCELKVRLLLASAYDSKWLEEGDRVEVGGHALFSGAEGSVCSVCAVGSNYTGTVIHEMLQPIRTPEQIAAEEIETILSWMVNRDSERGLRGIAEDLHADGYRKMMSDAEEMKS